jgi:DNA-binding PadR family transcriptional regulator
MRSSSSPRFDLRDAVDSLRETFGPLTGAGGSSGSRTASDRGRSGRERGDVRSAILIELRDEPMHAYQIIRAVETRSAGAWKPSPGALYPALQLLADEGLVTSAQVGERKVYSLTDAGRLVAEQTTDSALPTEHDRAREQEPRRDVQTTVDLARSGVRFAQALTQVGHSATAEQSARAIAVVDEARRKLYAILAED